MADIKFKLSPPWATYVNMIKAMFGDDPEVTIKYDEDIKSVDIFVADEYKSAAIEYLLPYQKEFGNVILYINVVPANGKQLMIEKWSGKDLFDIAFKNNPVFVFAKEVRTLYNYPFTFVIFKNKVVQFFNDNLNDVHGLTSTLYQTIAEELFADAGLTRVYYNTDVEGKVGVSIDEWFGGGALK